MAEILRIEAVSRSFDGIKAIDGLSMSVESGGVSAIIGPNGAGKTTLFNIICGYLHPDNGRIFYKGGDITALNPWERASLGIGRLFQDIRVFKKLTLLENLQVTFKDGSENPFKAVFSTRNHREKEKIEEAMKWLDFVGLSELRNDPAEHLSWGQQKLLCLARLLCGDFELLLIDEPVSGVNPPMAEVILEKICGLKEYGKTVMVVEHDMEAVAKIAAYIYFMDAGNITAAGTADDVLNNKEVVGNYLGFH